MHATPGRPSPACSSLLTVTRLIPIAMLLVPMADVGASECIDYGSYLHTVGRLETVFPMRSVEVAGSLAYVAGDSSGLVILDVSNPALPAIVGTADTPGAARDVKLLGSLAYIADSDSGVAVVDIANPFNPVLIGSVDTPGFARGLSLEGNYAYVADRDSGGLQVVDISNPLAPAVVGALDTPGYAYDVTVSNHRAYVADGLFGVQIIDVSDPEHPTLLGTVDTPGSSWDVFVVDTLAYVADFASGLQILDVSNPASPVIVGATDFGNPSYYYSAYNVVVSGTTAYLAWDLSGFQVFDVSNPTAPALMGAVSTFMDAIGVNVAGELAYVVGFPRYPGEPAGIQIIDISPPLSPPAQAWAGAGVELQGLAVQDNLAYILNDVRFSPYISTLQVVDVSNPNVPVALGSMVTGNYPRRISVAGDWACMAEQGRLRVVDVSDPAAPVTKGTVDLHSPYDVFVRESYAYVVANDDTLGFKVIDISDPALPVVVGEAPTINPRTLTVQGNLAYVLDYNVGLEIVDISNPVSPFIVGSLPLDLEELSDVAVSGAYAYVAARLDGLLVIDVSNPTAPSLVATHERYAAGSVDMAGHVAYLCAGSLQVVDMSNPIDPTPLGGVFMPGDVIYVDVSEGCVYVSTNSGLFIEPAQCPDVVPVVLSNFEAVPQPGAIELRWNTIEEFDHVGFHVQRSDHDGAYARVTPSLIPPLGPYVFRDLHVAAGETYSYLLEALARDGTSTFFGPVRVQLEEHANRPRLGKNHPNPFGIGGASTRIEFNLAEPARTHVRILDVSGREVRLLVDDLLPSGPHSVSWDGRDDLGLPVAPGIYLYRLVSGSFSQARRLALIR